MNNVPYNQQHVPVQKLRSTNKHKITETSRKGFWIWSSLSRTIVPALHDSLYPFLLLCPSSLPTKPYEETNILLKVHTHTKTKTNTFLRKTITNTQALPQLNSLRLYIFFFFGLSKESASSSSSSSSMESASSRSSSSSSSSSSSPHRHDGVDFRSRPTQPVADRIYRALRHHLRLLYRSEFNFFILGATGNVYTVTLTANPTCTCPDRTTPCKHILFVFIRVLGLSPDDVCLSRRSLRPCQLNRLLATPTMPEALAGVSLRERFHQLFFQARHGGSSPPDVQVEDGTSCPVCLEEMEKGERVVACGTCRNVIHEECLMRWKRSRGRRAASCVICRARWRDNRGDHQEYLNLSAYVSQDQEDDQVGLSCAG